MGKNRFAINSSTHCYSVAKKDDKLVDMYRNNNGTLEYCSKETDGKWSKDDKSFVYHPVVGDVSAVFEPQRNHTSCFWASPSGLTYGFWNNDSQQFNIDDKSFPDAGKKVGSISAVYEPDRQHSAVFCKGEDGYLHYYFVKNGSWNHERVPFLQAGKIEGDVSAVFEQNRNYSGVFFVGEDQKLHYMYKTGSSWNHDCTSFAASCPVSPHIAAVFEPQRQHSAVFVRGSNGYLHYWYLDTTKQMWTCDNTSFKNAGRVHPNTVINAIFDKNPKVNHSEVTFYCEAPYPALQHFFVQNGVWQHDKSNFKVHEMPKFEEVEQILKTVVSDYDFKRENDEEIDMKVGDVILVTEMTAGDSWWFGKNQRTGESGLFPSNYVVEKEISDQRQELEDEEQEQEREILKTVVVLFDYKQPNDDELKLEKGDVIDIYRDDDEDWWYGAKRTTGELGYVPSSFCAVVESIPHKAEQILYEIRLQNDKNDQIKEGVQAVGNLFAQLVKDFSRSKEE